MPPLAGASSRPLPRHGLLPAASDHSWRLGPHGRRPCSLFPAASSCLCGNVYGRIPAPPLSPAFVDVSWRSRPLAPTFFSAAALPPLSVQLLPPRFQPLVPSQTTAAFPLPFLPPHSPNHFLHPAHLPVAPTSAFVPPHPQDMQTGLAREASLVGVALSAPPARTNTAPDRCCRLGFPEPSGTRASANHLRGPLLSSSTNMAPVGASGATRPSRPGAAAGPRMPRIVLCPWNYRVHDNHCRSTPPPARPKPAYAESLVPLGPCVPGASHESENHALLLERLGTGSTQPVLEHCPGTARRQLGAGMVGVHVPSCHHPRTFQHHTLLGQPRAAFVPVYPGAQHTAFAVCSYKHNKHCPVSPDADAETSTVAWFQLRWWRQLEIATDVYPSTRLECMCRLCPTTRWLPRSVERREQHMAFAHGVVCVLHGRFVLLPLPVDVVEVSRGVFVDCHAQCGSCMRWVYLGQEPHEPARQQEGLFQNYFHHAMLCLSA